VLSVPRLIDTNRWGELTDRAFSKFVKRHGPISRPEAFMPRRQLGELHQLFRDHKIDRPGSAEGEGGHQA